MTYTTPSGSGCGTVTCDHPSGYAFPVGTTLVTCTSSTGPTCSFNVTVNDTQDPTVTAPAGSSASANLSCQAAIPNVVAGSTASDNCGSVIVAQNPTAGTLVGLGTHTITVTATDTAGNHTDKPVIFTVVDTTAPAITLNGNVITLWPPDHTYRTVQVTDLVAMAVDNCDAGVDLNSVYISQVTSDESENGNGDGDTSHDIVISADCKSVQLRAERQGASNGRVYTIAFKVRDASGNTATATATVTVPQSQDGAAAVDDGPIYTVLSGCP